MALTPGTRIGSFEITGTLGAGGMGEVYRARDLKLGREVAIKTLPGGFAQDPDRVARFEREAKLLAALNHANIAAIYGLDEHEGTLFLAMELIAGATLEAKLKTGPLPVEDALRLALQIAGALEAAHAKGVVHRDLKPANVMITPDGVAKVLDFGLAKAFSGNPIEATPAHSPALSLAMTEVGLILGTAGYMSPEQASGQPTDQRADIWAFGVLLYEMLTGLPLFSGESVPHILAAVLQTEPNWNRLPKNLQPRVRRLLEHCLKKKPRHRYHSIADVRIEIEDALGDPLGVTAPAVAESTARGRGFRNAFAVTALAAVALAIPALDHLRETPAPPPPESRVDIVTPAAADPSSFAVAPDGRAVAFAAIDADGQTRLFLRSLASTSAEPLAGTEGASLPFWSPDGKSIGFFAASLLKRLDLGGGSPRTLAPVDIGNGGSWSKDGIIVFSSGPSRGLSQIADTGGNVTAATTLGPQQTNHGEPHFLPDGRHFVFTVRAGDAEANGVHLASLDDGTLTRLTAATRGASYLPSGWLLWIDDGALIAQRLDSARGALVGQPIAVADRVRSVSVAASGLVAYRTAVQTQRQLQWLSRAGALLGSVGDADGTLVQPRVAPDGRRVAFARDVAGTADIWIQDGARANRLTFGGGSWPVWSPDGSRIAFVSSRSGTASLYEVPANGATEPEPLLAGETRVSIPTSWSADGRSLLYFSIDPELGVGATLGIVAMDSEHARRSLPKSGGNVHGSFSPDGRWIAAHGNRSGRNEVYVRPVVPPGSADAEARAQWQVSDGGGIFAVWSADGRELYYLNPAGAMVAVPIDTRGDAPKLGAPQVLFQTHIVGGGVDRAQSRQYDVSADGRFLINTELDTAVAPITLIQNWDPEAKP
jgi:Tol biopolymer transport system component